jgi:hypothetical protein
MINIYPMISDQWLRDAVLRDNPGYAVDFDTGLILPKSYIELVWSADKRSTIKFKRGMLRLPRMELPLVEKETGFRVGTVTYQGVIVKPYSELDSNDATIDGFTSLLDLRAELSRAYGEIAPEELLTIHRFDNIFSRTH